MTLACWCYGDKVGKAVIIGADDRITHLRGNIAKFAAKDKLVKHLETWWTVTIGDHVWGLYATELMAAIVSETADDPMRLGELAGPYLKEVAQTTERFYGAMASLAGSARIQQENAVLIAALDRDGEEPCIVRIGPAEYAPLKMPEIGATGDGREIAQQLLSNLEAFLPADPRQAIQASTEAIREAVREVAKSTPTVGKNGMIVTLERGRSSIRRF